MRSGWLVLALVAAFSCGKSSSKDTAPNPAGGKAPAAEVESRPDLAPAPEQVLTPELLRSHTKALSDDAMEGRRPGTAGGQRAVGYIVTAMTDLGLKPAGDDGSYEQKVPMRSVQTVADEVDLRVESARRSKDESLPLPFGSGFVGGSYREAGTHALDAPLVFAGYGITAPEYDWDDYAGVDVRGKVVVVFVGDPPVDDGRFGGEAMTYYGRWSYKFERALQAGAEGCLVIHETEPASYGWNVVQSSWSGQRFQIVAPDGSLPPALGIQGWISTELAQALAETSGQSLEQWHQHALRPSFSARILPARLTGTFSSIEDRLHDYNVMGKIPGRTRPDEVVLLMAHWDHLGTASQPPTEPAEKDGIYNGAVDNASGIAGLLGVAAGLQAAARAGAGPERTVMFLATTAEEQGLLGSRYFAEHPTVPLSRIVAALNIDSMNVQGRTKTVEVVGPGQSSLEDVLATVVGEQGRSVVPDSRPEAGGYYRSDHFALARKGVPALYFRGGDELEDGGVPQGRQQAAERARRYHTVEDEYDPSWSFEGAEQDAEAVMNVILKVAQAASPPTWKPTSEFSKLRSQPGRD